MEKFAGGVACEADRALVQRGKEGERWKGVQGPQDADGRAGYRMEARTRTDLALEDATPEVPGRGGVGVGDRSALRLAGLVWG